MPVYGESRAMMPCGGEEDAAGLRLEFFSCGCFAHSDRRSHPAERLSLADAFGVDDAQVPHIVLHAALVQGLEARYLLLLHSHNELPEQRSGGEKAHRTFCLLTFLVHIKNSHLGNDEKKTD